MNPVIQYEFYRHISEKVNNKFLHVIVKNLGRGIPATMKREIEKKGVYTSVTQCQSALITWCLATRNEKSGNVTSMLKEMLSLPSNLKPWKDNYKIKEAELNEILINLELPTLKLDHKYEKNYFEVRDILSE